MVPYLKKPECQTNLEDEVQPKGRGLFIGIVEQQLPTAIKKSVRAEPFHFFSLLFSPPVFLSVLFFSFSIICLATLGSSLNTAERCRQKDCTKSSSRILDRREERGPPGSP